MRDRCEAGGCIEVAEFGTVVRLHSTQTGTTMQAAAAEWLKFVAEVKAGVYDHIGQGVEVPGA